MRSVILLVPLNSVPSRYTCFGKSERFEPPAELLSLLPPSPEEQPNVNVKASEMPATNRTDLILFIRNILLLPTEPRKSAGKNHIFYRSSRIRTDDMQLPKLPLYQTELHSVKQISRLAKNQNAVMPAKSKRI